MTDFAGTMHDTSPTAPVGTDPDSVLDTGRTPTVWHCLAYRDAGAGLRFLVDGLGFERRAVYSDPDDASLVVHAELRWPHGGGVMLGSVKTGGPGPQHPGTAAAYCVTATDEEVDRLHERALAHGATTLAAPEDMPYGGRGSTVADPEGNRWSLGSYRGE